MKKLLNFFYHNPFFKKIIPTLVSCLENELKDCTTVLDLGCGADSPIQFCKNIKYSVGVEIHTPYLNISKKKRIHTKYINKKIEEVNFPARSFDAVIMLEVLEHLSTDSGLMILKKIEKWAKKKIVISSPNGFVDQPEIDDNPYQRHQSGWNLEKMKSLGYKCHGLAGIKWLRQERQNDTKNSDLASSIRFWPKPFWFVIASTSEILTYHIPSVAFEIFCVKKLMKN